MIFAILHPKSYNIVLINRFHFISNMLFCYFLITSTLASNIKAIIPCNPQNGLECYIRNLTLSGSLRSPLSVEPESFTCLGNPGSYEYTSEGLHLIMNERLDNPLLISNFYIMYGKAEVEIKASPGKGIILSLYLQSDDGDEIDVVETFGSDMAKYQTNFFVKGNTTTYDRGKYHLTPVPPMNEYQKYGVEWTPERIVWKLNDKTVRELTKNNPHGFPSSPMRVSLSLWAGGDYENAQGTIDWAGGNTDYQALPFSMYARNLVLTEYSTGYPYTNGYEIEGEWSNLVSENGAIGEKASKVDELILEETIEKSELEDISEEPESRKFIQFVTQRSLSSINTISTAIIWFLIFVNLY